MGDRYIQITPAYSGGGKLPDGATLATDSTSVPLELDQIYSSLNDLNVALGPDGANKSGALTDLLEVTADNFSGQGEQFNETITNFSQLSQTLEDNKEELFGSAAQLEEFIFTLAQNDSTVRAFNGVSLQRVDHARATARRRSSRRPSRPLGRARGGHHVRQGEQGLPVAQHHGYQPGREDAGEAAGGAGGDARSTHRSPPATWR